DSTIELPINGSRRLEPVRSNTSNVGAEDTVQSPCSLIFSILPPTSGQGNLHNNPTTAIGSSKTTSAVMIGSNVGIGLGVGSMIAASSCKLEGAAGQIVSGVKIASSPTIATNVGQMAFIPPQNAMATAVSLATPR
ncbi:unnamed protein product, partial [Protopolystoma xenopodis]